MPCGQLGGPTPVTAALPKSCPRELLGASPAALGRARRSSSSLAVSPLGRVGTQRQQGRALQGGARRSVKPPPARHTVSAFNTPSPDRVFIEGNHTERRPETTDTVSEIIKNLL